MSNISLSLACEESDHDDCQVNCGCPCHPDGATLDLTYIRTRTKAESDYWVNQLEMEVRRLRALTRINQEDIRRTPNMPEYRYYLVTRDALSEYADGRGMTREELNENLAELGEDEAGLVVLFAAEVPRVAGPEPTLPVAPRD